MAYQILKQAVPRLRGVLFDMDGVVIDTEKLFTRFWTEAAHALGWPMTRDQALQLRSLGASLGQQKMESFFGPGVSYAAIREKRIALMDAHIAQQGVEEKAGVRELLADLGAGGIPCAITSSSSLPVIRRHLAGLDLIDGFTALCSGREVPSGKPAPDIYLYGARRIGVPPETCLAIEDSPAGIESAWRAGCMPVIVPDQDQPDELTLSRCFARADSLHDVAELVRTLRRQEL